MALCLALVVLTDVLYAREFGCSPSLVMWKNAGEAWHVRAAILQAFEWRHAWILTSALAGVVVVVFRRLAPEPRTRRARFGTPLIVFGLALPALVHAGYVSQRTSGASIILPSSLLEGGIWYAHVVDVFQLVTRRTTSTPRPDADGKRELRRKLDLRHASPTHPPAKFPRANVILLQVESLNAWAIGVRVNGRSITPRLDALSERALVFDDVLTQTAAGRSSDADYLVLCSQHPVAGVPVATRYPDNPVVALPETLRRRGYATFAIAADSRAFWNGARRRQRYGFDESIFRDALASGEKVGLSLGDGPLLAQASERIEKLQQPFLAWVVTLSMHAPFDPVPVDSETLALGELEGSPLDYYLELVHYTDSALGRFVERLDRSGLGKNTLVFIYGDHTERLGLPASDLEKLDAPALQKGPLATERIPLLVLTPDNRHERFDTPLGLIDLAPTLLDLLDEPAPRVFVGRSAFAENGGFVTRPDGFAFDATTLWDKSACWSRAGAPKPPLACEGIRQRARDELLLSQTMTEHSLFADLE